MAVLAFYLTVKMAIFKVTLKTPGGEKEIDCRDNKDIFEAAEERGVMEREQQSWCLAGACGACAGQLVSGEVDQSEQSFLEDDQIGKDFVLLCVAYPKSDCIITIHQEKNLW
jgi:ferredoxin